MRPELSRDTILVAYVTIYSISGSGLGVYAYIYNTTIIIEMLHFKSVNN